MQECLLSTKAHGDRESGSVSCGNQTLQCTDANVAAKDGCHLPMHVCTARPCCSDALQYGLIPSEWLELPSVESIAAHCETALTDEDEPCFPFMALCVAENRANKGGCCKCDDGWYGWACDQVIWTFDACTFSYELH